MIYKFLDANVFLLLTQEGTGTLNVYLISSVSGRVLYKFSESQVAFQAPIDAIYLENLLIISFSRKEKFGTKQEIAVAELFKPKIEDDTQRMLKEAYFNSAKFNSPTYSSFEEEAPLVAKENYQFPQQIKSLTLTQTKSHITGKNLVLLTADDSLYMLEYAQFSARRPQTGKVGEVKFDDDEEDDEESKAVQLKIKEMPPYDGVIPLKETKYLTYGLPLN